MTASQCFRRFAIPFRVPLLFSPWMTRVTAVKTSSTEGKHCPHMGSYNLWNKLCPVDSCLDCMVREVTLPTHIYLTNRSQPSPGVGVHCHATWVAHPWAIFSAIFASSQIICCCYTCSSWNSVMMIPQWSKAKIIICLTFDCTRWNFLGRGEVGLLHSFDYNFNSGSKSLTRVLSIATIWYGNAWPSTLNICFSNVAISRRFCFSSAVK